MGDQNHGWKIENVGLIFSVASFIFQPPTHSPRPIASIAGPSMGDENRAENIKNFGLIFSAAIPPLPFPLQSSQDPRICHIKSSSNIFGNLLIAISNSRVPRLRWKREGNKNRSRKIWNVSRALEKIFYILSVDKTSHPAKLTDIKLLGLAAPLIWPDDLQCGRALIWTDNGSRSLEANTRRQEGKYPIIKVLQGCILKLSLCSVNTVLILYRTGNMQSAILLSFLASSSLLPCGLQCTHTLMPCYISPYVVYKRLCRLPDNEWTTDINREQPERSAYSVPSCREVRMLSPISEKT